MGSRSDYADQVTRDTRDSGQIAPLNKIDADVADIRTATDPMRLVAAIDTLEDSLVMYDADDRLVLANQAELYL